jgi:hypothetical protein
MKIIAKGFNRDVELTLTFDTESKIVDYEWSESFETSWYLVDHQVLKQWINYFEDSSTLYFAELVQSKIQEVGILDLHQFVSSKCHPKRVMNVYDGFN